MSKNESLLSQWLSQKNKDTHQSSAISARPRAEFAPLSLGQRRLWFLQQLYPENPFYNYAESYRFYGDLNIDAFLDCLTLIAKKHEILRTTFHLRHDAPVQKVHEHPQFDIGRFDVSELPEIERDTAAQKLAFEEARRPFELTKLPLIRVTIIKRDREDHQVVVTMHHIVTDKWSMRVFRNELAQAYPETVSGHDPVVAPVPVQYADFAVWERNQDRDKEDLEYWRSKLNGYDTLSLPTDFSRPVRPSFKGAYLETKLSKELSGGLKDLSKHSKTTLFVLLLTVFKLLLKQYTGQDDIVVGTPITNRDKVELEELIGFFNDTLVLRSDLSGDPQFSSLLGSVKQTVLEAFGRRSTPFESIVDLVNPERYLSTNPLFQVMFIYHEVPENPSFGNQLEIKHEPFDLGVSKFDLTLYIAEETGQLSVTFEYAEDLFKERTIKRMHSQYAMLLESIVSAPGKRISSLPSIIPEDLDQILNDWNDTSFAFPKKDNIHQLFEECVENDPASTALVFNGEAMTYKELDQRAASVACTLNNLNLERNSVVGLCAGPSFEMIVGLLGILKAGHAYMPLDPEYPAERINFMLEDARVRAILSDERHSKWVPEGDFHIVLIAGSSEVVDQQRESASKTTNQDRAYVIYTSGSTGRAKGVPVSHGNLLNSTLARRHYYDQQPGAFLLLSSFAFDSSVAGIFWTLCCGGTLVLADRRAEQDLEMLTELIAANEITHTLLLPSLYRLLLDPIKEKNSASLSTVILAGEACNWDLCRDHFAAFPEVGLFNEYGPTEATVWCTVHAITEKDGNGIVPIGVPIANTSAFILNSNMDVVPVGAIGELYIGGNNVVAGYLTDREGDSDSFVPNPFGSDFGGRLYRTGDLARYRDDGTIEFRGRKDNQVKIRGHRIELDEIALAIEQDPRVKEAIVTAQKMSADENLLNRLQRMSTDEAHSLINSVEDLSRENIEFVLKAKSTTR